MDHIDITPNVSTDEDISAAITGTGRHDGWTPFARCLFLQVLAETGRVGRACEYAGMSPQSAYALRNRDSLFATGWDAACHLARNPLADALSEQAADGLTETIRRNGEIIAERHRHDSRLSIAVLHRLDKRCDRAEDFGARHLPVIARWDEWLELVARGDDAGALDLIENARSQISLDHQLHQLSLAENPTQPIERDDDGCSFWQEEDGRWMTDFSPPAGFCGEEQGTWGDRDYIRSCTDQERDVLDRLEALDEVARRERADRSRDAAMADLMAELADRSAVTRAPPSALAVAGHKRKQGRTPRSSKPRAKG